MADDKPKRARNKPVTKPQRTDPVRREIVERWIHLYRSGDWEKEVAELICYDEAGPKGATLEVSPASPTREKPSHHELQVVECLSHGLGTSGAADVLFKSIHTVKSQVQSAKYKTAAKTVPHLIAICLREGWIN